MWIRIENCEQDISSLREALGRGEERTKTLFAMLEKIEIQLVKLIDAVDNLRVKPAKRWDTVITTLITGGVGAFLAWFLTKGTP
jgi:hypothetical protein